MFTIPTESAEREVRRIDRKPERVAQLGEERFEGRSGNIDRGPTAIASQMVVLIGRGQVDDTGTMPEVDMVDQIKLLEHFQRPVYGRGVDRLLGNCLSAFMDLGWAEMVIMFGGDHLAYRPAGFGYSQTLPFEHRDEVLSGNMHFSRPGPG